MIFPEFDDVEVKDFSSADELQGKLASQFEEDKLMKSVLKNDKQTIDEGKLINEAINHGINAFTPDLLFDQLVKNYSIAKHLYGEKLIRLLSGYNPDYIKKNINIPEFQRELRERIEKSVENLKGKKILSRDGAIEERGIKLASVILYMEELDHLLPRGMLGEKIHKKHSHYGSKQLPRMFRKGDRYKDIAVRQSVRLAVRRGHKDILPKDLKTFERESKGSISIIYGLDASGSMRGKKLETGKKAGIALAYKAISNKDSVGLIVFGKNVKNVVEPTTDFGRVLLEITRIRAASETNYSLLIEKAVETFPRNNITKHLVILTDALPTVGKKPKEETLEAVSLAKSAGITISVVGINLDDEGKQFAESIVKLSEGRMYIVKNLEELDRLILEDYNSLL